MSLASDYDLAQAPTPEKPIKSKTPSRDAGSDSENEASKQLLAPDGTKLPFHIPTDDPNDSETVSRNQIPEIFPAPVAEMVIFVQPSELLEDARAQVRREQ